MSKFGVSILKGEILNPSKTVKYDITTNDSELDIIISHVNKRESIYDVPERCFEIDYKSRLALKGIIRNMFKYQQVIKSLFYMQR